MTKGLQKTLERCCRGSCPVEGLAKGRIFNLHLEDLLEKEIVAHSSALAWKRGAWWAVVHGVTRVGRDSVTKPPPQADL